MIEVCLNAFKNAIREINPSTSVQKALSIRDANKLYVGTRTYELNKNVQLVGIGKAAQAMVEGAEEALGDHLVGGIALAPTGTNIHPGLKTRIFTGAEDNLPDENALENTKRIEEFIAKTRSPENLLIFLISGGGSALLPAPVQGISLEEKVELIRLIQSNGADIKQLNAVRTALSRLKGGGLAKLSHPSKMISLIISDIVGDPLELISSGPTVIPEKPLQDPISVLNHLDIFKQVPAHLVEILRSEHLQRTKDISTSSKHSIDICNVIIASNSILLNALSTQLANFVPSLHPFIVTNRLEGNATELGVKFAKLIQRSFEDGKLSTKELIDGLLNGEPNECSRLESLVSKTCVVLLFGGESTVRFTKATALGAKGGRNQEMVLSALHQLSIHKKEQPNMKGHFALFSLGSDGQDGPTDATGAFFSNSDLTDGSIDDAQLKLLLDTKCSYLFWSEYKGGQNLVKTGKTGVNVMDVQILFMNFTHLC